jgi:2-oxoglutarate ferredoxin oxidoreductase subunit alpha
VGLLRPLTLSPFPYAAIEALSRQAEAFLVVEMNAGQMLDDVMLAVAQRAPVAFYGRMGGVVPFPDEILEEIRRLVREPPPPEADPREAWFRRTGMSRKRDGGGPSGVREAVNP